jgi:hypothetical protein
VPEGSNIEVAHNLQEHGHGHGTTRHERILEILEALLLAFVAIATAYSGYQSARWDGRSAEKYADSSRLRAEGNEAETRGGQQRLYDTTTFDVWLLATTTGDEDAADLLEERFTDNYRVAFDAWLKTDPLNNPEAPPGPMFMPEYRNTLEEQAVELDAQASEAFTEGADSRATGEQYVRITVFLATVLFLIAMSQRFDVKAVRLSLLGVALVFLAGAVVALFTYPHL